MIDYESCITAKMLAQRLGTVASNLKPDGSVVPLYIRIHGERHALTIDNFQVDEDGSLLFSPDLLLNIERNTSWTSVLAERIRQIHHHGYTAERDDTHRHGELALAGAAYAVRAAEQTAGWYLAGPPAEWPWDNGAYKPRDTRRALVVAGALIVAEIERLDRKAIAGDCAHD
ncbi:hypothetical protein [Stutzerimonas kirkiae]|uniref:hypothetical protein n=1 Tax=Stutzerimonas kirkiae TaxID=2211392 RepID=UPI0010385808|nr:hypothetical protein [Stutzerimonas kirkiae]TBV10227.1 hypothetical protein DNK08_07040 [Stutzerimonas kirkiae]